MSTNQNDKIGKNVLIEVIADATAGEQELSDTFYVEYDDITKGDLEYLDAAKQDMTNLRYREALLIRDHFDQRHGIKDAWAHDVTMTLVCDEPADTKPGMSLIDDALIELGDDVPLYVASIY